MANAGEVKIILAADAATYTAALQKARAQLNQLSGDAAKASAAGQQMGRELAAAGHGTVAPWMASSAALRLMEGNITNNIRAAERFVAMSPIISAATRAMFPVIGAIALGAVFARLVERVVTYQKTMQEAADKAQEAWRGWQAPLTATNSELQVSKDHLQDVIAKLEGKPSRNGIVEAVDDAIVELGKLGDKLDEEMGKLRGVLKDTKVGWFDQYLGGQAGTADLQQRARTLQLQLEKVENEGQDRLGAMRGTKGVTPAEIDAVRKQYEARYQSLITTEASSMRSDIAYGQGLATAPAKQRSWTDQYGVPHPIGETQFSSHEKRAESETDYLTSLNSLSRYGSLFSDTQALQRQEPAAKSGAEARKQAQEETKRAQEQLISMLKENAEQMAEYARTPGMIAPNPMVGMNGKPAIAVPPMLPMKEEDLSGSSEFRESQQAQARSLNESLQALNRSIEARQKEAASIAESAIKLQVATGQMSRYEAAQAMAALHTQDYVKAMQDLDRAQRAIDDRPDLTSIERQAQLGTIANQRAAVAGDYSSTHDADVAAIGATTSLGALREATDRMTQAFTDLPAHLTELVSSAINGFNEAFSSAVMAHADSGQEYRRNIENSLAGQFRSTGAKGLDSALQMGEGGLLSALGFGKPQGKPDGTAGNPLYVRNADGTITQSGSGGSGPSGLAGMIQKIFGGGGTGAPVSNSWLAALGALGPAGSTGQGAGNFLSPDDSDSFSLPFMASGGSISSNMPAIVGENGPELFMPSSSGRIVPNGDFGGGGGSGDVHLHIDARGATDPASVEFAVQRGMNQVRREIAPIALAAHRQYNRARPGSSRM